MPVTTRCVRFIVLVLLFNLLPHIALYSGNCKTWTDSIAQYSSEIDRIIGGEVIDILQQIKRAVRERQNGNLDGVVVISKATEKKLASMRAVDPPAELSTHHQRLIDYTDAVVRALNAIQEDGIDYRTTPLDQALLQLPTKPCYEKLIDYYRELLALLEDHQCDEGDIEALKYTIIPGLQTILEKYSEEDIRSEVTE